MSSGVDELRTARGSETVTFGDVADHLDDFARSNPGAAEAIERLASFLASVERVGHEHDRTGGSSVTS